MTYFGRREVHISDRHFSEFRCRIGVKRSYCSAEIDGVKKYALEQQGD